METRQSPLWEPFLKTEKNRRVVYDKDLREAGIVVDKTLASKMRAQQGRYLKKTERWTFPLSLTSSVMEDEEKESSEVVVMETPLTASGHYQYDIPDQIRLLLESYREKMFPVKRKSTEDPRSQ